MGALIPGMEGLSINFAGYISQILYWVGVGLASFASLAVLYFVYHISSFRIKATVFPMFGSGTDGVLSVGKPKGNQVKWVNKRTAWRSLWPLFNKIDREPFDDEYIYPGNRVYVFDMNGQWSPGRININVSEAKIRAEVNPVPHYIRNWQSLQHKKIMMEFAQPNFWEQNKMVITTMVCCVLILVACLATVYFAYRFSTGGVQAATGLTQALQNFGSIAGK